MGACTSTPNQREEIEAYRDEVSRDLHRTTATGKKTKQVFGFKPMTHIQLTALQNVMKNSLVSEAERKYSVTFWDEEAMDYRTGNFYIPDITYTREWIDTKNNLIHYAAFDMTIVEY